MSTTADVSWQDTKADHASNMMHKAAETQMLGCVAPCMPYHHQQWGLKVSFPLQPHALDVSDTVMSQKLSNVKGIKADHAYNLLGMKIQHNWEHGAECLNHAG